MIDFDVLLKIVSPKMLAHAAGAASGAAGGLLSDVRGRNWAADWADTPPPSSCCSAHLTAAEHTGEGTAHDVDGEDPLVAAQTAAVLGGAAGARPPT